MAMRAATWIVALGALCGAASACSEPEPAAPVIAAPTIERVTAPIVRAPTEAQQRRFVNTVLDAARASNAAAVNAAIDWKAVAHRAAHGLHTPSDFLDRVVAGARAGCERSGVCRSLAAVGSGQARLTFLGPVRIGDETWISFRRMPNDGGFDHVRFLLSTDEGGVARAIDVLVLSVGETSSSSMRRALLPMLVTRNDAKLRRLEGTDSNLAKHGDMISRAQSLASEGKPHEALTVLNALPAVLRNDPLVMAQRVTITRMTGDQQAYLAAIEELAQRHPNDAVTVLNLLDAHTLRGRYTEALAVLDRMQSMLAPDPYLDVLRSNLQTSAGLLQDAIVSAQRAIDAEPELVEGHWALLSARLKLSDHAATSAALRELHRRFGITVDVAAMDGQPPYAASPEYAQLKAELALP